MTRQMLLWRTLVFAWILLTATILLGIVVYLANEWVASTLATVTLLAWLSGWLVVAYQRERVRAAALGAIVAGGVYWLMALGPWFSVHIGPTLLTSRLLAWADPQKAQAGQQLAAWVTYPPQGYATGTTVQPNLISGSAYITTTPQIILNSPATQATASASTFQVAGQWAFVWLLAIGGAAFAWLLPGRLRAPKSGAENQAGAATENRP